MPNIKSAKKRVKVTLVKTAINKNRKTELKTALKKAERAIDENVANKDEIVKYAVKRIDQACAKGIMHKNSASRKKAQLALKLNKVV